MRDDLNKAAKRKRAASSESEKKFVEDFTREAMRKLDEQMKAGWSPAKSSWHLAKEATTAFIGSCDLAWENAKIALRCSCFAAFLWLTGCAEATPPECQFYVDEIAKAEHCIDIGGCARGVEAERRYIDHMEAELEFCKARHKLTKSSALQRE